VPLFNLWARTQKISLSVSHADTYYAAPPQFLLGWREFIFIAPANSIFTLEGLSKVEKGALWRFLLQLVRPHIIKNGFCERKNSSLLFAVRSAELISLTSSSLRSSYHFSGLSKSLAIEALAFIALWIDSLSGVQ